MVPDSDVSALTAHHIAVDGWSREVTERHMRERLATQRASPTTDVIFMIVALCSSLFGLLRINNWMVGSFFASFRSILQPNTSHGRNGQRVIVTYHFQCMEPNSRSWCLYIVKDDKEGRRGMAEPVYLVPRDRDMHVSIASRLDDALCRQVEQCTPMVLNRFDLFSTDWTQQWGNTHRE